MRSKAGWCKAFISDIEYHNEYNARWGQAQKVINMAFKYLYSCSGTEKYIGEFRPCHIPLDQFTLLWLFSEGGKLYVGWSYFGEESYNEAQKEIMKILKENALDKEFVIWEEIQKQYVDLEKQYKSSMLDGRML